MYTITWIQNRRIAAVSTPSEEYARTMRRALRFNGFAVRLWNGKKLVH